MGHPEILLRQGSEGEGIVKPVGAGVGLCGGGTPCVVRRPRLCPCACFPPPARATQASPPHHIRHPYGHEAQMPHMPMTLRRAITFTL